MDRNGPNEIKLDGYRLEVVRSVGKATLYSRRQNVLNQQFPYIATPLNDLPDDTVIDGELTLLYHAFDILIHKGRCLTELWLTERQSILSGVIKPGEHVALSQVWIDRRGDRGHWR
jgi:ATP-dependent DNA ligase